MATFTKRKTKTGNVWRVQLCVNGVRKSATRDTKAQAQEWAEETARELRSLASLGITHTYTLGDAIKRYMAEITPTKRGKDKEALRLKAIQRDQIADILLVELKPADIADWRDRRLKEVAPASVKRDMNILYHLFTIAVSEWGWLKESPAKGVKKPKEPPARDRLITDEEIERICLALGYTEDIEVKTIQHRIAVAFLFAIETAMRAGEICSLTSESIKGRVAHLPQTKNGFPRDVPLSKRALELWDKLPGDGFELTVMQIDSNFRKAKRRAGLDDIKFHDTRHLAVTRLSRKLDVLALAKMTGHRNLAQLRDYYNETPESLADRLD